MATKYYLKISQKEMKIKAVGKQHMIKFWINRLDT